MRLPLLLIALAAASATGAGLAYRASLREITPTPGLLEEIPRVPERFLREHPPPRAFALDELPQWGSDPVLVDTAGAYLESAQYCGVEGHHGEHGALKAQLWHDPHARHQPRPLPRADPRPLRRPA